MSEELVSVIEARVADELGSALAMNFLSILCDRGAITHRQMLGIARQINAAYDIGEITGRLTDEFARAVGLPTESIPDVPPGLTQQDMSWLDEGGRE